MPQIPIPIPLAYSIADAVKASSIGRTSLYGLIRNGDLEIIKVGRRTLVRAESLRRLVDGGAHD